MTTEERAALKADILGNLKTLGMVSPTEEHTRAPEPRTPTLSDLQFRITTAADVCAIIKMTAFNTNLGDREGIDRIFSGVALLSQALDECAAMAQIMDGFADYTDFDTVSTIRQRIER